MNLGAQNNRLAWRNECVCRGILYRRAGAPAPGGADRAEPFGYEILRVCDGTHTLSEVIEELETRFPTAKSILSQEVLQYLEAISQKGLIEWT